MHLSGGLVIAIRQLDVSPARGTGLYREVRDAAGPCLEKSKSDEATVGTEDWAEQCHYAAVIRIEDRSRSRMMVGVQSEFGSRSGFILGHTDPSMQLALCPLFPFPQRVPLTDLHFWSSLYMIHSKVCIIPSD